MSICIPSESCGINEVYISAERSVDFAMSDSISCIKSSEDYIPGEIGSDCTNDYDGCNTGL